MYQIAVRWQHPVLHIAYPYDRDVHLRGRGLLLAPAFFGWLRPITVRAPDHAPVLVDPIEHQIGWFAAECVRADARLPALLGDSRAAVLQATADGAGFSTTEIPQRVGLSMPNTSHHTNVLREAV